MVVRSTTAGADSFVVDNTDGFHSHQFTVTCTDLTEDGVVNARNLIRIDKKWIQMVPSTVGYRNRDVAKTRGVGWLMLVR